MTIIPKQNTAKIATKGGPSSSFLFAFFAGATPGYAECFVWHNLDNCFAIDKTAFAEYIGKEGMDKLMAFYDRFAALDGIKEYLARRPKVWGLPGSRAQPTPGAPAPSG